LEKITVVLKPDRENIKRAAKAMSMGAIIIYPTESSYAIGCDFTNKEAVDEVYKIKKRSRTKHTIVIVPSLEVAKQYGKINAVAELLVKKFMPGPLTIAVPGKTKKINELNFRISENSIARMLATELGKPIVATSANISGKENVYSSDGLEQFFGMVDAIIDAGDLPQREVSTVVKVDDNTIKILREGAIPKEKIKNALKVR